MRNLCHTRNCVKQNMSFLGKMFHTNGIRGRGRNRATGKPSARTSTETMSYSSCQSERGTLRLKATHRPFMLSWIFSMTSAGVTKSKTLNAVISLPISLLFEPKYLASAMSMQALPLLSAFVFYKRGPEVIHLVVDEQKAVVNCAHCL